MIFDAHCTCIYRASFSLCARGAEVLRTARASVQTNGARIALRCRWFETSVRYKPGVRSVPSVCKPVSFRDQHFYFQGHCQTSFPLSISNLCRSVCLSQISTFFWEDILNSVKWCDWVSNPC